jgi:N6-L-threonylcarbamoyladenine synthase
MRILGIETSCDETSAAVLEGSGDDATLKSLVILSQDVHRIFGGVVPEIASRAHLTAIVPVVERAISDAGGDAVDAVAVTNAPGLVGALLVGVSYAKAYAFARGIPVIGVHHMEGHLFATALEHPDAVPPFTALLVSGGHTMLLDVEAWGRYRLLGKTRDDAAGEAFDKVARLLGLPYPGGPALAALAERGAPDRFAFPRPLRNQGLDFSFSGLKTAARLAIEACRTKSGVLDDRVRADLAASFQAAAVDTLTDKCRQALESTGLERLIIAGGVGANRMLRASLAKLGKRLGVRVYYPRPALCTDNGAMIAYAGWCRRHAPTTWPPRILAKPRWPLNELGPPSEE